MNWKEYKKKWKDCAACDLAKTRHNIVLARGSVHAMFSLSGKLPEFPKIGWESLSWDRLGS